MISKALVFLTSLISGLIFLQSSATNIRLPDIRDGSFDYQLGGKYKPAENVKIVVRDRLEKDPIEAGLYNVCYINGFQTQPGDVKEEDPDNNVWAANQLLLKDSNGNLIVDSIWQEYALDIREAGKRNSLFQIVKPWIEKCAKDGFDAVEFDNMDIYLKFDGLITIDDVRAMLRRYVSHAHQQGLAVVHKNAYGLLRYQSEINTDFAILEDCAGQNDLCSEYIEIFDDRVFIVEYSACAFYISCKLYGDRANVIWRDRGLKPLGDIDFRYAQCSEALIPNLKIP